LGLIKLSDEIGKTLLAQKTVLVNKLIGVLIKETKKLRGVG